jgi:sulfite reductase (NADPH) hemoprotein beta-component
MFDSTTRTVSYDVARGEPRKGQGGGDCIDCGICVQVCPVGIDIRDGFQYPCINCGLCVDACDEVMIRVAKPVGLIRFASEQELAGAPRRSSRPRLAVYAGLIGVFVALGAWTLAQRSLLRVDVLRDRGSLSRETADGRIENAYTLKLINMAEQARDFEVAVSGLPGIELVGTRRFAGEAGSIRAVQRHGGGTARWRPVRRPADHLRQVRRPTIRQPGSPRRAPSCFPEHSLGTAVAPTSSPRPFTMYRYNQTDQRLVDDRVAQFRDQMTRFLDGRLERGRVPAAAPDERPLLQRHALHAAGGDSLRHPGQPPAAQARRHRAPLRPGLRPLHHPQNIQFNWPSSRRRRTSWPSWPRCRCTPSRPAATASATSPPTSCRRGADELFDPRPYCEIVRQWSTLAPRVLFLPRKFKIAFTGAKTAPRCAFTTSAIAPLRRWPASASQVFVGGGLGRTPIIGKTLLRFLPRATCSTTSRRSCGSTTARPARQQVQGAHQDPGEGPGPRRASRRRWRTNGRGAGAAPPAASERGRSTCPPTSRADYAPAAADDPGYRRRRMQETAPLPLGRVATWPPPVPGYAIVTSVAEEDRRAARRRHRRADGRRGRPRRALQLRRDPGQPRAEPGAAPRGPRQLPPCGTGASRLGLATPNIGLLTDLVCCPGGDFCSLANARSIPVAAAIQQRFDDLDYQFDLGELELNMSGCINACGHHHVGHIGILGVDKNNEEWYQVTWAARRRRCSAGQGDRPVLCRRADPGRDRAPAGGVSGGPPRGRDFHRRGRANRPRALQGAGVRRCSMNTLIRNGEIARRWLAVDRRRRSRPGSLRLEAGGRFVLPLAAWLRPPGQSRPGLRRRVAGPG